MIHIFDADVSRMTLAVFQVAVETQLKKTKHVELAKQSEA